MMETLHWLIIMDIVVNTFGTLIKLDYSLDSLWQKQFNPGYKTIAINCIQTNDNGFLLTGWIYLV